MFKISTSFIRPRFLGLFASVLLQLPVLSFMAPDQDEIPSISLKTMVEREPTVSITAAERKKELRLRINAMHARKQRMKFFAELMETEESKLVDIQRGACAMGQMGLSDLISNFREMRIKENKLKHNK